MAVVNGKELGFYSFFLDIKGYADSIFVVVPDYALMGVDSVAFD